MSTADLTDDFLKSLAIIAHHILGMEADLTYLEKQILEPFLRGLSYDDLGKLIQQAPNFATYKWQEFEQNWEQPKLRKKNATPQEITDYQQKKYTQSLSYEIAACIARHAYFRRDLRKAKEPSSLMPYVRVLIQGQVDAKFPFKDDEVVKPNDPRFSLLKLEISPDIPSISFTRQRTKLS
jgi:hypothetical protein